MTAAVGAVKLQGTMAQSDDMPESQTGKELETQKSIEENVEAAALGVSAKGLSTYYVITWHGTLG